MKRAITLFVLIISLLTQSVFSASAYNYRLYEDDKNTYEYGTYTTINGYGFKYRLLNDNTAAICHGKYFVPDEIEGHPVSRIDDYAFAMMPKDEPDYNELFTDKLIIPKTVKYIGEEAFRYNSSITSLVLPEGLVYLGKNAFKSCYKLREVSIPSTMDEISEKAFLNCPELETVSLTDCTRKIGKKAFYGCSNLKKINMPRGLSSIGEKAFYNCPSMKTFSFFSNPNVNDYALGFCDDNEKIPGFKIVMNNPDAALLLSGLRWYCSTHNVAYEEWFGKKLLNKQAIPIELVPGLRARYKIGNEYIKNLKSKNTKVIMITNNSVINCLKSGYIHVTGTMSTGNVITIATNIPDNPSLRKGLYKKEITSVKVKLSKSVKLRLYGKVGSIPNKYTTTKCAKITSKKNASTIKIQEKKKGSSTLKITVNGVYTIKLRVKVV